jgi:glycosyltransferase involved in cell wall biosynthesis
MPRILFAHTNFPAQFGAFGRWLHAQGWDVAFVTARTDAQDPVIRVATAKAHREVAQGVHPYAKPFEQATLNGQAMARAALSLDQKGFTPDVVVAHAGWGAGAWLPDLFPKAAFVSFVEWWYTTPAPDATFLTPTFGAPKDDAESRLLQSARNAPIAFDAARADVVWCPTRFQADRLPRALQHKVRVEHDGIDTVLHAPAGPGFDPTLGGKIPADAPLFTYATRGQEPHRGFVEAIGALAYALKRDPNARAIVVGANRVAYGGAGAQKVDWRSKAMALHTPDTDRLLFLDTLPRDRYLAVLQRSNGHLYLTAPFVLSWSMLESMAVGVPLVASDTDPVREYATDGVEALLRPFYDSQALGEALLTVAGDRDLAGRLGGAARARIQRDADAQTLWPQRAQWLADLVQR